MLNNFVNYGIYEELVLNGRMRVDVSNIKETDSHVISLLNILRDGIETQQVEDMIVEVYFNTINDFVELSIMDYMMNVIMWKEVVDLGSTILPNHLFYDENLTRKYIKKFIDYQIIIPHRRLADNIKTNETICDSLDYYKYFNEFSMYTANTINLEDDIRLMKENPIAYDLYHSDLSAHSLEDTRQVGSDKTNQLTSIIMDTDYHCLADFFRAKEGVNVKQYKEYAVNIGTKPTGEGDVFPYIINSSFIRGGLNSVESYFVEQSAGRTAQILSKTNVGDSGYFAKLLGLNNSCSLLHKDPDYVCDSQNFQRIFVRDEVILNMFADRWYRESPVGMERVLLRTDYHLIGKEILVRSPMTCASNARDQGVCYRCYGNLAYTNFDINIGKLAAELLSSVLTQMLLSAKHLLESAIEKIEWSANFDDFFLMDGNIIEVKEDIVDISRYSMVINLEDIDLEDKKDDYEFNESVKSFVVRGIDGTEYPIYTTNNNIMYLSGELNDIIRGLNVDLENVDELIIPLNKIEGNPIFLVQIMNNELSKTLNKVKEILNKKDETGSYDRHQILQSMLETMIEGGVGINAVHCEMLLSNQLRNGEDIMLNPDWSIRSNENYQLLTIDSALRNHQSVTIRMNYKNLKSCLYNPLTFKCRKSSYMDLFTQENPLVFLDAEGDDIEYSGSEIKRR